ncbi:MAG: preprotein translocase subunit SecA [Actinomycetes bacterium]
MVSILYRALRIGESKKYKEFEKRVKRVNAWEPELETLSDEELREAADELRERARGEDPEPLDNILEECFALVREAGRRTMGMRHFDVQLIGGMVLHSGAIAEMKTGEGKTLTGTLPVVLNSMAGRGVHVVTVNDYLATRDAEWMSPIYDLLGVTWGVLQTNQDHASKRAAYACDVTYGTNSEFGFDYLRDNMATSLEEKVQHGGRAVPGQHVKAHVYGIVDEVDNILIDEARTPLIISGAPEQAADLYGKFAKLAKTMVAGKRPEGMDPKTKKEFTAEFDYEFDEKHKTVAVTEQGVTKAERFLGVDHLYRADNGYLVNHLIQSLKAESLYKRDVDYAVVDGEVNIIDEFTGRILEGRRWSEGLHQAVEAKEGVRVQEENQTLATVTLQNYFRMYEKLAGMTGTALTEATEFMKIYELQVVQIPTNRDMIRNDMNDQVFKTREGKWSAVAREIEERHAAKQPVLVGTISVEVSELLSERLKKKGIEHTVLNAKPEFAQREGETVALAGLPGAVTIATNMAGRGVDIKLGGSVEALLDIEAAKHGVKPGDDGWDELSAKLKPELEARIEADREVVMEAGGLCIIGTERHESRRIDNQLRGRAGRQGDPGSSRFFLSAEDDLVRLFAGDRIYKILDKLGGVDAQGNEEPIEAGMLSKQIEKAQRKVEEQNFLMRKRVLEYDDVLNQQREVIYRYRDEILEGADMSDQARQEMSGLANRLVQEYTGGEFIEEWDLEGLFDRIDEITPSESLRERFSTSDPDPDEMGEVVEKHLLDSYDARREELGPELMGELERYLLLEMIDQRWKEHLYDMDYLREGIHLRGFAQEEPLVAYKNAGFEMFGDLVNTIWADYARMVFNVVVELDGEPVVPLTQPAGEAAVPLRYSGGTTDQPSALAAAAASAMQVDGGGAAQTATVEINTEEELEAYLVETLGADTLEKAQAGDQESLTRVAGVLEHLGIQMAPQVEQRVVSEEEQIGRNDPCWCGSGKKFKKCHGV